MINHVKPQQVIGVLVITLVVISLVSFVPGVQAYGQQQTPQATQTGTQAATQDQGATAQPGGQQTACGDQYIVRKGDTLGHIALRCNTTVAALLGANTDITDRSRIFTGQTINIPQGEGIPVTGGGGIWAGLTADMAPPRFVAPQLQLTQQVTGEAGQLPTQTQQATQQATQPSGQQATQQPTPTQQATQPSGQQVTQQPTPTRQATQAATQPAVGQPTQAVTQEPTQQQGGQESYTVQQGDTLTSIAAELGVTVDELLQANPQIISPGDVLTVPSGASQGGQQIQATPTTAAP